jgi:hypothetical protein
MRAQPQPEHRLIEHAIGIAILGELVEPHEIMLRPAHLIGLARVIQCRDRAIRPSQPALGRLINRFEPGRRNLKDPALALDNHIAAIGSGFRHQANALRPSRLHFGADRLRAHPRLPPPTPRNNQPPIPVNRRRLLPRSDPGRPTKEQLALLGLIQCRQQQLALLRTERFDPAFF